MVKSREESVDRRFQHFGLYYGSDIELDSVVYRPKQVLNKKSKKSRAGFYLKQIHKKMVAMAIKQKESYFKKNKRSKKDMPVSHVFMPMLPSKYNIKGFHIEKDGTGVCGGVKYDIGKSMLIGYKYTGPLKKKIIDAHIYKTERGNFFIYYPENSWGVLHPKESIKEQWDQGSIQEKAVDYEIAFDVELEEG